MASARATRRSGYTHDVVANGFELVSDEPVDVGGNDEGPNPPALLAAALASCTAITVEMYADRKGWELGKISVDVEYERTRESDDFKVTINLPGGLSEEQTQRITTIAGKCPVHKALAGNSAVTITDTAVTGT